jgi:hypothetical protein
MTGYSYSGGCSLSNSSPLSARGVSLSQGELAGGGEDPPPRLFRDVLIVGVNLGERGPLRPCPPPPSGTFIPFGAALVGSLRPLPQGRFKKIEQKMYISPNRISRARQKPVIQKDPKFNSTVRYTPVTADGTCGWGMLG